MKEGTDPELVSVKQLLKLLDKAAKSARTYGAANPVAHRFFQQFHDELTKHLTTYSQLTLLVQRSDLYCKDQVVYQPDRDATGESIAFKMYADGIRELSFYQGITSENLSFFLEALWGSADSAASGEDDDEDIVTRLWGKNLSTITIVTACSTGAVVSPQAVPVPASITLSTNVLAATATALKRKNRSQPEYPPPSDACASAVTAPS